VNARADIVPDARARLADATRTIHEALHHDPVLSVLTRPGLTPASYAHALTAFQEFFTGIEAARRAQVAFPAFSLAGECQALFNDTGETSNARFALGDQTEVLGTLYVAHGSAFGKGTFRTHVTTALPHLPHFFVLRRSTPAVWRDLVAELDAAAQVPGGLEHLETGAHKAFGLMQCVCARIARDASG